MRVLSDTSSRRGCITAGGNFPRIKTYVVWSDSVARELSLKAHWTGNKLDFYALWESSLHIFEDSSTVVRTPVGLAQHGFDQLDACRLHPFPALLTKCCVQPSWLLCGFGKSGKFSACTFEYARSLDVGFGVAHSEQRCGCFNQNVLEHLRSPKCFPFGQ